MEDGLGGWSGGGVGVEEGGYEVVDGWCVGEVGVEVGLVCIEW